MKPSLFKMRRQSGHCMILFLVVSLLISNVSLEKTKDAEDESHGPREEIPKEKYTDLEGKIPGLKDGMFNGKKVKSITRIGGPEEGGKAAGKHEADNLKKLKAHGAIDKKEDVANLKKIKSIMHIDDDLALKMKAQVAGGKGGDSDIDSGAESGSEDDGEVGANKGGSSSGAGDPNLLDQVERILKMFNVSSLDDIVKATPLGRGDPSSFLNKLIVGKETGPNKGLDSAAESGSEDEPAAVLPYGEKEPENEDGDAPLFSIEDGDALDLPDEDTTDEDAPLLGNKKGYREIPTSAEIEALKPVELPEKDDEEDALIDQINKESENIKRLDSEIDQELDLLAVDSNKLAQERKMQEILHKMLLMELDKIKVIKAMIRKHKNKELSTLKAMETLQNLVKNEELEKKRHLAKIKKLHHGKKPGYHPTALYKGDTAKDLGGESGTEYEPEGYMTDGHIKIPVSPIRSIKKIKSMLKLTDEQAKTLRQWQEERNNKKGKAIETIKI